VAVIYLRHERHGEKVACGEAEARHDESHGWRRFDPHDPGRTFPEPAPVVVAEEPAQWANRAVLNKDGSVRQKSGRKPKI